MVQWQRTGSCNRCGECCKTLVSEWFMTGYDPIKGPRTSGCIYLEEQSARRYKCLIRTGELDFDSLSENVKSYYLRECLPYPNPENPAHCPPRFHLLKKCGHKIVEAG